MTIKRRLFISNILMLVMPMLLTTFMGLLLFFIAISITGIDPYSLRNNSVSYISKDSPLELMNNEDYTLVTDDITAYKTSTDGYIVVMPDDINVSELNDFKDDYYIGIFGFLFLLVVVYLTNRALTRFVFRSIVTPIDTLVNGVHEIRDGNLAYRIQYNNNDEFAAVCSDFNEMALRLSDMVNERQKDETNRRELIAGISHDLRTPLTSIKAYLEGIETGVASTPQMKKKYLDTIKIKADDLEYIINQLFLFSKLDIGEFPFHQERVDIGGELSGFVARCADEYKEKGLTVSLAENVQDVFTLIDTVQFRNVIHNVLENSAKYGNKKQTIAEISSRDVGDDVVITIKDNGPGVSENAQEKLFDVFYREDSSRKDSSKGSGLGLAITKKIVERLGGEIHAENVPDGGLTIVIVLPKCKGGEPIEENIDY